MSSQTFRRGTPALPDPSELRSAPDDKNPPSEGDSPTVNRGFRPDVEGLRALAVVAVIVDHLFDWPSGGFVGVDVFFVISGFLITGLLLKEYERTKTISFLDFYKRRVRRIMPAALLVLVVSTAVSFLVFNVVRAQASLWDAVWSALFVSNWHFASAGTDYFASDGPISPFRHYWSLSVEEQFYLVWPVLIFLVITFARRRTPKNRVKRARLFTQTIGITVGVLIVASLAWGFYETSARPTVAYFSTFSRAWELGIGALLAIFAARLATLPAAIRPVLGYVGLAGSSPPSSSSPATTRSRCPSACCRSSRPRSSSRRASAGCRRPWCRSRTRSPPTSAGCRSRCTSGTSRRSSCWRRCSAPAPSSTTVPRSARRSCSPSPRSTSSRTRSAAPAGSTRRRPAAGRLVRS
ncbi:acyltransferase family protein [Clavibacter michiganensis]|uniref:acyltransferase family protein n=1 Tax=Clavibacter michiganensis TaxID=28447 RepID=UPI001FB4B9A6|nr:acyltransferase [Clavibacter michiganensis]